MRVITQNEYSRLTQNLVWSKFVSKMTSGSKKEMLHWLISTAQIESAGRSHGKMSFEDMMTAYTTYEAEDAIAGLKINRQKLEDLDGGGIQIAAQWASDIGFQMAYWPQKLFAAALKSTTMTTYDGLSMFHAGHYTNGKDNSNGIFANLFTGAASGVQPGALPIDDAVTVDVALTNLSKAVAAIKSIKMPNGSDPRYLRPTTLIVPPRMAQRAVQLTNAKFIAQAAASGGGSGDVAAVISSFGFTAPVVMDELAGFENDKTYFIACEASGASELGAFVYVDREPFRITYYTGQGGGTGVDAVLDRADELEWHCKGRNVIGAGHPFKLFKVQAT
jgi:phage major head subunit gpT-like protein